LRPQILLRAVPVAAAAGAFGIVVPTAAAPAATLNLSSDAIQASVKDASLRPGQAVVVSGRLASGQADAPVRLQLLPAGSTSWVTLRDGTTGPDGRFALRAHPRRSGAVRVVQGAVALAASADGAGVPASAQRRVSVGARLVTHGVRRNVSAGRKALVRGAVAGGGAGRTVALQLRGHHGWYTVDRDRTDGRGRFTLDERLRSPRSSAARLHFAGDARNASSSKAIGHLAAFRSAYASWYGPGLYGNPLGCGGTLTAGTIGVANKELPCGTKLTLRYHGRTVNATVVDRGPYVAGREFDLTSATAQKLGFGSLGTIQVSLR
jgi:hypothetical protein